MKTGDIVRIEGAYFKNDNGLYFVANSPGDPNWLGNDFSLRKINKNGTLSMSKGSTGFWPLGVFVSNWRVKAEAKAHNQSHASCTIVSGINTDAIVEFFMDRADGYRKQAEYYAIHWGEAHAETIRNRQIVKFNENVAKSIRQ